MATDLLAYIAVQGWIAWVPRRRVPVLTRAGAYSLYASSVQCAVSCV
jgi:hypothetical protein